MKRLGSLILAISIYVALAIYLGFREITPTISLVGWAWWVYIIVTVAIGHIFLLTRWHLFLRILGYPLSWIDSTRIYVGGLSLIMAPARGGETVRGIWLKRLHEIPIQIGVSITLSERLLDLASALVILAWGIGERILPSVMISALIGSAVAWLLTHPKAISWLSNQQTIGRMPIRWHRAQKVLRELLEALTSLRKLMKPKPLIIGLLLSASAWMLEAWMLKNIFQLIGTNLTLSQSAAIRTISSLAGVFSLLPAGLGTSEISAIGMALFFGASRPQALTATLILRISTVLVPFIVGSIVFALNSSFYRKSLK